MALVRIGSVQHLLNLVVVSLCKLASIQGIQNASRQTRITTHTSSNGRIRLLLAGYTTTTGLNLVLDWLTILTEQDICSVHKKPAILVYTTPSEHLAARCHRIRHEPALDPLPFPITDLSLCQTCDATCSHGARQHNS